MRAEPTGLQYDRAAMCSGSVDAVAGGLRLLLEFVLVCSGSLACAVAKTWWQIERAGRRVPRNGGQIIVVFGAEAIDGQPSAELAARLRFAASLYRAALAPLILCSGGHPDAQS